MRLFNLALLIGPSTQTMIVIARTVGDYGCIEHLATTTAFPPVVGTYIIEILFSVHTTFALWTLHFAPSSE